MATDETLGAEGRGGAEQSPLQDLRSSLGAGTQGRVGCGLRLDTGRHKTAPEVRRGMLEWEKYLQDTRKISLFLTYKNCELIRKRFKTQ